MFPLDLFAALEAGDILFIDSSHKLTPGSDVELLITQILPAIPAGVLVHIHDIFLPGGYPASWSWRNYNEQAAVAALFQAGGWMPLFASSFVLSQMSQRVRGERCGWACRCRRVRSKAACGWKSAEPAGYL